MYNRLDNFEMGKRIQTARKKKYRSQSQFADALHVDRQSVQGWESGKHLPDLDNLISISDLLDVDLDYLTGRIDCMTHETQFICDQTGLSEPAVKNLCMLNADTSDHDLESNWILQTINALLENCISGSAIEEGTLWMSPLYHIAEYIGITPSPTINGEDKAWLSFNTGNAYGQYSQVESVRELYAERTLRQITRDLDHLKKILENKK